jgi:hypothetical protein
MMFSFGSPWLRSVSLTLTLSISACGSSGGAGTPDGGGGGGGGGGCNAQNCAGCCMGGVCQPGTTTAGCGRGGLACQSCPSSQTCLPEQRCGLDPAGRWLLAVTSASIAPTNNGSPWDLDRSPPDAYVTFNGSPTTVRQDSYTPTWDEGYVYPASQLLAGLQIQVFDEDVGTDDPICAPRTLRLTEQDFAAGTLSFSNWDGVRTIGFALQRR